MRPQNENQFCSKIKMVYGYNEKANHKKKDIEFQTKEFVFFTF